LQPVAKGTPEPDLRWPTTLAIQRHNDRFWDPVEAVI